MCRWTLPPLVSLILLSSPAAPAADFLRGDANDDGRVSISDSHFICSVLFREGAGFACEKAADADDNGSVSLTDAILLLNHLFEGKRPPAAPFPTAGVDPTADNLPCPTYGNGQSIEDPDAEIAVLDATAAGGDDSSVTLIIAVSSSRPLGGYSARIVAASEALEGSISHSRDLTGSKVGGFEFAEVSAGILSVGFLVALVEPASMPPGNRTGALEVLTCLRAGLPAGEYALTIEEAELIDAETGLAIRPRLVGGALTVASALAAGVGCTMEPPPPPPIARPDQVDVDFRMEASYDAAPATVIVPLTIRSNTPVEGFSFSIDFDEHFLRLVAVDKIFRGGDWESFEVSVNGADERPGGAGTDEGYVAGEAVFSRAEANFLPPRLETQVLRLRFEMISTARGCAGVRFADGGLLTSAAGNRPIRNVIRALGRVISPEDARSFDLDGAVFSSGAPIGVDVPGQVEAEYRLPSADAAPGGKVTLPFSILANAPVQGFAFSADFDEEVLRGTSIEKLFSTADGQWDFWRYEIDNSNARPGNAGVDEGFVVGAAVFELVEACSESEVPAGVATDVVAINFEVLPEAGAAVTEVVFADGAKISDDSPGTINNVAIDGRSVSPDVARSFIFLNGRINIAPDIAVFIRGDSDGNGSVELTDAQQTLGYLFLGQAPPACEDAADADDSGKLAISDPVLTLNRLFRGGPELPAPYPLEGNDPTDDGLGCRGP
jgi:hypothetical protein